MSFFEPSGFRSITIQARIVNRTPPGSSISRGAPVPCKLSKDWAKLKLPEDLSRVILTQPRMRLSGNSGASGQQTPEDALQKFNESRPNLVKAGICILYVARVINQDINL